MARLDSLLADGEAPNAAALERGLSALRAELAKGRPRTYRADAALLLATSWGFAAATAVVLAVAGQTGADLVLAHLPQLALLVGVGAACALAAMAPWRTASALGLAAAAAGLVGLVALRALNVAHTPTQPEWVCTASHLSLGVVPLAVALLFLKRSAPHPWRALLAGFAAGTSGAMVGEVGCGQGWQHIAVYHLGAWVTVAAVVLLAARRLKRSSYAP